MYQLYLSDTCPKGVAAQDWLAARKVECRVVNLDNAPGPEAEHRLRLLIRAALVNDEAEVMLPVLTELREGQEEQIRELGFEPSRWEEKLGANES